jgi:hypothetical protein
MKTKNSHAYHEISVHDLLDYVVISVEGFGLLDPERQHSVSNGEGVCFLQRPGPGFAGKEKV